MDRFEQLSEDIGAISPAAPDGPEKRLDDSALMRLHSARGEPRVFLNKLRVDARTKLVDILKQASDELRQRKTEYDAAPAPEGTRKPPYALSYEKFPQGSMGREMMLLNLCDTELVAGCPTACGFCGLCAVPVKVDLLDPIPEDQIETLFDELFDVVGELTGGNEKLQLGALNRIVTYLATDSFYYKFIERLLLYLGRKGVSDVVLSTTLPKAGQKAFERVAHHCWLQGQITKLSRLTASWNRTREIVKKVLPQETANLPLPQLMEFLESCEMLCRLMQIITKISHPRFQILNKQEQDLLAVNGVDQTHTVSEALQLLKQKAQAKMAEINHAGTFEQLVQDFEYTTRRKQITSELQGQLADESEQAATLPFEEKSVRVQAIYAKTLAMRQQVETKVPKPASVDFLEKTVRLAEGLRRQMKEDQRLLDVSDQSGSPQKDDLVEKTKADDKLLQTLSLPDLATLERDPSRDQIIAAKIAQLQAQLEGFPQRTGVRVSVPRERAPAVRELQRGQFNFTAEDRYPLTGSWRKSRGRSFKKEYQGTEPDFSYRVGVALTPYGMENIVPVLNSTDCTSSLLRVPFENFEDNPRPVEPGTPLFSVLAHVIVIMSKKNTQKDFFFAFDGVNVRKITFDKNTHVVKQDEILYGPIQTMDDIRKFFKFRGTLTPKCATCKDCFGIVPKRPEEIKDDSKA